MCAQFFKVGQQEVYRPSVEARNAEKRLREEELPGLAARAEQASAKLAADQGLAREQLKMAKLREAAQTARGAEKASLDALLSSKTRTLEDVIAAAEASLIGQRVLASEDWHDDY